MIPVKATVTFDGTISDYTGKVVVGHTWVYLVEDSEMYPREKVGRVKLHSPFKEFKEKIEELSDC